MRANRNGGCRWCEVPGVRQVVKKTWGGGMSERGQTAGSHFTMTSFRRTRLKPLGINLSAEADVCSRTKLSK